MLQAFQHAGKTWSEAGQRCLGRFFARSYQVWPLVEPVPWNMMHVRRNHQIVAARQSCSVRLCRI